MAKVLTPIGLAKLKADPAKRLEIPDGKCAGLYYIIQPSDARSWAVRYRIDGKPRKLTLGTDAGLSLADAREAARAALNLAEKGTDPTAAKKAERTAAQEERAGGKYRFETVLRSFFNRHAKAKNRSWRETARLLGLVPNRAEPDSGNDDPNAFVLADGSIARRWGERDIREISAADVIEAIDRIVDRGALIVANRTLASLRKLFNWAIERQLIASSPCVALRPPSEERSRDRILSDDEVRWLWLATAKVGNPFGPLVRLLLLTGQRRDEVAGMTAGEIQGTEWLIPKERAKNNSAHHVPLMETALATINAVPRIVGKAGYIFTTTGETPVSGWSRAKTILDRAMLVAARQEATEAGADPETITIPHWTLHDLRRTAASGMARLGVAVHVVERLLNHRSGTIRGVALVYNRHDYHAERASALGAWESYLMTICEGRAKNVLPMIRPEKLA